MNRLATLVLGFGLLLISAPALASNGIKCRLQADLPRVSDLPITPLWAQEISGVLDANTFIQDQSNLNIDTPASVLVFDSQFDPSLLDLGEQSAVKGPVGKKIGPSGSHGNRVVSNLLGRSVVSASKLARLEKFIDDTSGADQFAPAVRTGQFDVISSSVYEFVQTVSSWFEGSLPCSQNESGCTSRELTQLYSTYFARQTLIVAAGNNYPAHSTETTPEMGAINVGAFSELGIPAGFSNESSEVHIYAPAGSTLLSYDLGKFVDFGGTSGAQPLVAGTVASAKALLRRQLTTDEVRLLLKSTASLYYGPKGPMPVLNALRFIKTVMRLREMNWGERTLAERSDLLGRKQLTEFALEARQELNAGLALIGSENCKDLEKGAEHLRRAFLLGEHEEAREALVRFYEHQTLRFNSLWYSSLSNPTREGALSFGEAVQRFGALPGGPKDFQKFDLFKYLIQNHLQLFTESLDLQSWGSLPNRYLLALLHELRDSSKELRIEILNKVLASEVQKERFLRLIFGETNTKYFLLNREDYRWVLDQLPLDFAPAVTTLARFCAGFSGGSGSSSCALFPEERDYLEKLSRIGAAPLKTLATRLLSRELLVNTDWNADEDLSVEILMSR